MKWWKWLLIAVITLLSVSLISAYALLRLSLPQYEGSFVGQVSSTARLERDAQGYLSIHAANRNDAAYALGFSHAQERFFQMDLLQALNWRYATKKMDPTKSVPEAKVQRILEAIRILGLEKKTRFYQASTSELYGLVQETPQKETTPFYPRSPYAVAKLYAYWITVNYREAYGMFACNGILFNHESPVRGENFVTRKITRALSRIKLGLQDRLYLGNLEAKRDWGHAKDFVEMQWLMLQQEQPEDFVIATGVQYSVRDFVNEAAQELGVHIRWEGQGVDEKGFDAKGNCIVSVDPRYFRPTEVETLLGDATKAKQKLGWAPKISFQELVQEMVREDLKSAERDELVKQHGYYANDYHE